MRNITLATLLALIAVPNLTFAACPTNFRPGSDGLCHFFPTPCQAGYIFGSDGTCHPGTSFPCQAGYRFGEDGVCRPA